MSRIAKATLVSVTILSTGTIFGVHYIQKKEKEVMHAGIIRDKERKHEKLKQNQLEHERQVMLRKEYEKIQPVLPRENEKSK
ncbi:450_t:CDS:2 [Dentiscutata erythropus]|uniref:450_t:CDS:1 n=1 Tax=Dentiscutata erythropus TaxID=1348616 RepID=A0A9N8VNC9_9GLOM|nr:450_t:CDS:2 [Dentiscutata erythropus]